METISYAIADDHHIFREGLRSVLAGNKDLHCVGEAVDGLELLELLSKAAVNIALVDLKMPNMDGIQVIAEIQKRYSQTKVIILTMYDDEHFILHLMENGASGYLLKNADPQEIVKAINCVHENGYYFNDLVSKTLLKKVAHKDKIQLNFNESVKLNDKEIQILQMICQEYTTVEIGEKVFLSPRTIEGIRSTLLEKIGVRNTAGLVLYAVRHGLFK